eukprot:750638-Hanusia_phi.AAC.1
MNARSKAFNSRFCSPNKGFSELPTKGEIATSPRIGATSMVCASSSNEKHACQRGRSYPGPVCHGDLQPAQDRCRGIIRFEVTSEPEKFINKLYQLEKAVGLRPIFESQNETGKLAALGLIMNGGKKYFEDIRDHLHNKWVSLGHKEQDSNEFGLIGKTWSSARLF